MNIVVIATDASASQRGYVFLLAVAGVGLLVSGIAPHDRLTWLLEVIPVIIAVPLLVFTRARFPFTGLVYGLIAWHAAVLMLGGHYTYAEVPLGNWVRDALGQARNNYDRLGHFTQGFVPAMVAREILLRRTPLQRGGWLFFLVTATCLAISACYEFIEWWTAVAMGTGATDFLGTQGDVWDTQWDMFTALLGSILAQVAISRLHERQLSRLAERPE